ARRGGGARALERACPGSPVAARGRAGGPDPDDEGQRGSRRARGAAAFFRAPARRGCPAPLPGREDRDRTSDRERVLLRLRVSGGGRRGGSPADRGRDSARARGGAGVDARGGLRRRGTPALRGGTGAVQGRARRDGGGGDLLLHAGPVHG